MSIESAWEDAAYFAALVERLIETKSDEDDQAVVEFLTSHSWLSGVLIDVLVANRQTVSGS